MKGNEEKRQQEEKVISTNRKGNTIRDRGEEGKGNGKGERYGVKGREGKMNRRRG